MRGVIGHITGKGTLSVIFDEINSFIRQHIGYVAFTLDFFTVVFQFFVDTTKKKEPREGMSSQGS